MTTRPLARLLAIPFVVSFAASGWAHIAGGGPSTSDCYVELEGIESSDGKHVECTDGDPECDHDGACGNGCIFEISACAFRTDSALPNCAPQTITGFAGNNAGLTLPATPISTETCGEPTPVTVALKRNGKKAGKRLVKLTAISSGKPKKDKDKVLLRCLPRTGACPAQLPPTTTTTTTVSGPSTTRFTTTSFTGTTTTTTATTTTCPPNGLGPRRFSLINGTDPVGSHFYSSGANGGRVEFPVNAFDGKLELCGGVQDGNGVAALAVNADSTFGWKVVNQTFICVKVLAAGSTGKIACNGGVPVGMDFFRDSHGTGDNEDEILLTEQGSAAAAGSGYIVAPMQILNCPDDDACPNVTAAADCSNPEKVNYNAVTPSIHGLTTGTVVSHILNPLQGGTVSVTKTGQPFSCSAWMENGPGIMEMGITGTDDPIAKDTANVLQIDD